MNKERALKLLEGMAGDPNNKWYNSMIDEKHLFLDGKYTSSEPDNEICLDANYTINELEAILYWMKHKEEFKEDK